MSPPVLTTRRLALRPAEMEDAALIEHYSSDPRLARMTTRIPHPFPQGTAETFLRGMLDGRTKEILWVIVDRGRAADGLVGVIVLRPGGEIGYWIGRPFWCTGLATEAVGAVIAHAPSLGHRRLFASVFQDNPASARVLTKCGFDRVGTGSSFSQARGCAVGLWLYEREMSA